MGDIRLVMAREPVPDGPSVFLAGPSAVRGGPVPSWRPDAIAELRRQWIDRRTLTVLSPESRGGRRAERYEHQWDWENVAREAASVVLFWIPRDMRNMPGMTTNVEFGVDIASRRRVVLGCPPDCPDPERNRYLIRLAQVNGAPVCTTLAATVAAALQLVQDDIG
ncbi:nucleoside 2-deoxyribosyltransferase domain-containing protein [Actinosynnema sp. NPDC051121]